MAGEGSQMVYPEAVSIGKNWPRLGLESLPSRTIPVVPWLLTLLEAKTGPESKDSPAHPWTLQPLGGSNGQVRTRRQVEAPVTSLPLPAVCPQASLFMSLSLRFSPLRRG